MSDKQFAKYSSADHVEKLYTKYTIVSKPGAEEQLICF